MANSRKKRVKISIFALLFIIIYLVATLVIPPAFHPRAGAVELPQTASGERVACIEGNMDMFVSKLITTLGVAGAIAVGVSLVSSVVRIINANKFEN
jgi:hypothetical protein